MAVLIVVGDALEDLDAVLDGGLRHGDGLEAPLEGGVLFDVLAVLGEGRRADDLYLAPGEGGLQDVRSVHAALGVARADDVVDLVYDEDDVPCLADLLDEPLHAALELAAELRACDEGREVEEVYLLVAQLVGDAAVGYPLGKPLRDGRLADAGLAYEAGVVLLPAVEDLDDALELLLAADHGVELALARSVREVYAVIIQKLLLGPRRGLGLALLRGSAPLLRAALRGRELAAGGARLRLLAAHVPEEPVQEGEGRRFALVVGIRVAVFDVHEALGIAQGFHHLVGQAVQLVVGEAHLVYHVVHGLDVQLARALEAEPLVLRLAALQPCYEYHRHILLAA